MTTTMANDSEVLRTIWSALIPVEFSLAQNEILALEEPQPFYALVPRISYFPLVLESVVKHFNAHPRDIWLDFEGTPLKWHLPVGLLYDALGAEVLPFKLTVHFKDFPEDQLLRCGSRAAVESLFMSCVKEADALKHRSEVMSRMQKKEHSQLWSGVANDRFEQFWTINRQLMDGEWRHVPLRVYNETLIQKQKLIRTQSECNQTIVWEDLCRAMAGDSFRDYRWITHGIEPPLETPVVWLSQHLSYADNFLHVCALKKS